MAVDADNLAAARELVQAASKVLVLTGAGISTDSGIPDFRGPDGLWTKNPGAEEASDIDVYVVKQQAREAFWKMMVMMHGDGTRLKPNRGHLALLELEVQKKLLLLVTQNVDGLHHAAGNSADLIVEVHGSSRESICLSCGDKRRIDETLKRVAGGEADPSCKLCGGLLKANVVLFGEPLPEDAMPKAMAAASDCDLILCLGSTLSVYPVAGIVPLAKQGGAKLVIVNQGATSFDGIADVLIPGSLSEVLPLLCKPSTRLDSSKL
eukprot:gb/GFBE01050815.1/.p1 GENE.gb/GFBE01050815.1/~~gb/GFBE01050815.1/.p1  ORF type:complete len:265 (+),score=60.15 gb/GFBE01050815.1/:1-795(+)